MVTESEPGVKSDKPLRAARVAEWIQCSAVKITCKPPRTWPGSNPGGFKKQAAIFSLKVLALQCYLGILVRYMLCYFKCNEYLVSDIWDVSLYNDQFPKYKLTNIFFFQTWQPTTRFFIRPGLSHWLPRAKGSLVKKACFVFFSQVSIVLSSFLTQ